MRSTLAILFLVLNASGQSALGQVTPLDIQRKINPVDGQTYVLIPDGTFTMGCSVDDRDCEPEEFPVHQVRISKPFWLAQTEVTVAAWKRYRLAAKKKPLPTKDEYGRTIWNEAAPDAMIPVVLVTWGQARDFCEWAGGMLPTEAQWEHAARAGVQKARYGNARDVGWSADNSGLEEFDAQPITSASDPKLYVQMIVRNNLRAHPVAQKLPNEWGLYDMLGNASEWVQDWMGNYKKGAAVDPKGPRTGDSRVRRGGSWQGTFQSARLSNRLWMQPGSENQTAGFRCALSSTSP